jgi:DNA invertase Pin-like site-specific DNA recombinase
MRRREQYSEEAAQWRFRPSLRGAVKSYADHYIAAAVAEHEREAISERTKAALAAAKARGKRLGTPRATMSGAVERVRVTLTIGEPRSKYWCGMGTGLESGFGRITRGSQIRRQKRPCSSNNFSRVLHHRCF